MKSGLEDIGYVVNLTGKHWTLKHPQSQRKFRFYKLARDGRYDEEHIMERILCKVNIYVKFFKIVL